MLEVSVKEPNNNAMLEESAKEPNNNATQENTTEKQTTTNGQGMYFSS